MAILALDSLVMIVMLNYIKPYHYNINRYFKVISRGLGSCRRSICSRTKMAIQKLANYGTR